jgi:hypothetical protein
MKRTAAIGILLLLTGAAAYAQNTPPAAQPPVAQASGAAGPAAQANAGKRGAGDMCQPDLAQFCSAVQPGMGRLIACLNTHKTALRPACLDRVNAIDSIEAGLAAQAHEPVDQFMAEEYARQAHSVTVKKLNAQDRPATGSSGTTAPAAGTSPATSGQTPPPNQTPPQQ